MSKPTAKRKHIKAQKRKAKRIKSRRGDYDNKVVRSSRKTVNDKRTSEMQLMDKIKSLMGKG